MYRTVTSTIHPASVVSSGISQRLGVSADLDRFSSGTVDIYIPKTISEYQQYRRFMHDILCLGLIEAGLYAKESLTLSSIGLVSNDKKLMSLKPDLYTVQQNVLRVCEVSLTFNHESMLKEKNTKYNELFQFIEENSEYQVQYSPLIIDLTDAEWEDNIVTIPSAHMNLLRRFIENLVVIHSTADGESFRIQTNLNVELNFPFCYDKDWWNDKLLEEIGVEQSSENRDLINRCTMGMRDLDLGSADVESYFDKLTDKILTMKQIERPYPHPEPKRIDGFEKTWSDFKHIPKNTEKMPVLLQLGSPLLTDEVCTQSKREVWDNLMESKMYGGYVDHIKSTRTEIDEFLEDGILRLDLTQSELENEMMQGPGRKKYIKMNNMKIERKPPTHIGISPEHSERINELIDIFNQMDPQETLIQTRLPPAEACGNNLYRALGKSVETLSCNGFDYLLAFYSRITTEIILNSMKRRKVRQYVLGHSGFEGVWFLIAPGPQLRTESNTEFVKIISEVEPVVHILSREWHIAGNHWESDWLSVDTDRLKHWARARDRVNLSIMGSAEKMIEPGFEFHKCLKEEISQGNYGLMSLIYLEDKANTSTCIQTTRYVMMKSLGDKQLDKIMQKFPQRVNSVLQSHIMQRMVEFTREVCGRNVSEFLKQQNVRRDENVGTLDETTTGVVGKVPRIFTFGQFVPIKYTFNEIYWCMMYNKDRQNKTQDSMKILQKIAKEELKFRKENLSRKTDQEKITHLFGYHSVEDDLNHISSDSPESHYFSAQAVSIGVSLQDKHSENYAPRSAWLSNQKIHEILNKNLSEYATFKASVKSIKDVMELDDEKEIKEVGRRTKCIELVHEIVANENLHLACQVAMSFSGVNSRNYRTIIQIFKKNQIGGVREILILYIKARILINLTEEISRLLSKSDKRETLTKGKDKRLMMRGDYEELSSKFPQGTPLLFVKNSYDMATWCQKFLPTIFLPIYNYRVDKLDGMIELCRFVMITHCLKEIEFPQKLVEQWIRNKDHKHDDPNMEFYKRKFLDDRRPKMTNVSNMGQGILHYNSTVLALVCQSLRDELFARCLKKLLRPQAIYWKTRVGSDDKGDTIALDMSMPDCVFQAKLLEQCASAAERLCAMELSVKSASGHIIYEFNSAYMANLEVQSPVIKFTLAAVDMIGTDSCAQFINESYSRIRQLRENGGTSLICMAAHMYNQNHFNSIFSTGPGMVNDPTHLFSTTLNHIPYDFGNYPIYDADVQDMIGPEFHNYLVFCDKETPVEILRMLYTDSVHMEDDGTLLPDKDEGLFKKDTFNISQGLVRQLENMKSRLNLDKASIERYLQENPFLIIRGAMSPEETAITIASKLYTRGAATSLRRTSPVIYLGRLTAFKSARAWSLMLKDDNEEERPVRMTFSDYISNLRQLASQSDVDIRSFKSLIFPQHNSFEVVRSYVQIFGVKKETIKSFSQSIRSWILNNYNYNFYYSLKDILETSFGMSAKASRDDVMELRKSIPFDISSYESFIENCRKSNIKPLDLFYYLTKVYKSNVQKKAQVFAYGPSTSSLNLTLANIKKYNHMAGSIMEVDFEVNQSLLDTALTPSMEFDRMKLAFNICMLEIQGALKCKVGYQNVLEEFRIGNSSLFEIVETSLRNFKSLSKLDSQMRKVCIMLASRIFTKKEFASRLLDWKQLCFTYLKKQKKNEIGVWSGDLKVLVNYSDECYTISQTSGMYMIETNVIRDLQEFQHSLYRMSKVLQTEYENFFIMSQARPGDFYKQGKSIFQSRGYMRNKQRLNLQINREFRFYRINDLLNFRIEYESLDDGSTQILLKHSGEKRIVISHYPGHYYPVDIPKSLEMNDQIFVNGLRVTKLFKQRQWFFNGRLFPFTGKEAIKVLQDDLDTEMMRDISIDTKSRIQTYMDEYEQFDAANSFEQNENMFVYDDLKLQADVSRQTNILDNSMNLMEAFQKAADDLRKSAWADEVEETEVDWSKMAGDEDVVGFVKALGENKIRKAKRDFFTLTNLKLNVSFAGRILDLFFKSNTIRSEEVVKLPDYALHVMSVIENGEADNSLMDNLLRYIVGRMSTLTGKTPESLMATLHQMSKTRKHYNTLDRLTRYLNVNSPDLYDLLGGFINDQLSDSEDDAY